MAEASEPVKVVFVGGAPRSGTTVTHALLCTAPEVGHFHPEVSFIRPVFDTYSVGIENWDTHTRWFFKTPEHLRRVVWAMARHPLSHIWAAVKRPTVLCLKDPLLTPKFPVVKATMEWPCQFVTVLRHPHDVVRSQQEVHALAGVVMGEEGVRRICIDYMASYAHLDDPAMVGSVLELRYEDLGMDWQTEQLRAFTGLAGIAPSQVWVKDIPRELEPSEINPFYSPKYHRPIDTTRRLDPLAALFRDITNEVCAPLMARCGYLPDGRVEAW